MLLQAVLHLPIAQFDFPAMAVELDDVSPREAHRVNHRGQHLPLFAIDSTVQLAGFYRLWLLRPLLLRLWTGFETHQHILTPQLTHHLILRALVERQQPVTLTARALPGIEQAERVKPFVE